VPLAFIEHWTGLKFFSNVLSQPAKACPKRGIEVGISEKNSEGAPPRAYQILMRLAGESLPIISRTTSPRLLENAGIFSGRALDLCLATQGCSAEANGVSQEKHPHLKQWQRLAELKSAPDLADQERVPEECLYREYTEAFQTRAGELQPTIRSNVVGTSKLQDYSTNHSAGPLASAPLPPDPTNVLVEAESTQVVCSTLESPNHEGLTVVLDTPSDGPAILQRLVQSYFSGHSATPRPETVTTQSWWKYLRIPDHCVHVHVTSQLRKLP
jgi:hypothetical protein